MTQPGASTGVCDELSAEVRSEPPAAPARIGPGWLAALCAALLVASAGIACGGYLALRSHQATEQIARDDVAALRAAKDCISALQAPNATAIAASQQKIIDCATGDFSAQAVLYGGILVDAYQAANAQVAVSDMRAAVERHNDNGSVDVLVAVRLNVTNSEVADREQGYRLRVHMVPDSGHYKIARLDQVAS